MCGRVVLSREQRPVRVVSRPSTHAPARARYRRVRRSRAPTIRTVTHHRAEHRGAATANTRRSRGSAESPPSSGALCCASRRVVGHRPHGITCSRLRGSASAWAADPLKSDFRARNNVTTSTTAMPRLTKTLTVCRADELPEGEMRLVERRWREVGRLQLRRRAPRDRGPLLARRRAARRGRVRRRDLHRRVPAPRLAVRPAHRKTEDPAGLSRPFEPAHARVEDGEVKLDID